jgi:putative acyl-CoA dehydrogenase
MRSSGMNEFDTHEVFNQAPPFEDVNLFACDPALQRSARARRARAGPLAAGGAGRSAGPREVLDLGAWPTPTPRLVSFDRSGHRIDEVEFHPAWHRADGA